MSEPAKLFLIGLDAGDKDLISQWAREGALPAFKALFEKAAWGTTKNPPAHYVGSVWPSFSTGTSPARHGRYCFNQIRPGTYNSPSFSESDFEGDPFWLRLSQAGKRVAAIDVPKTVLTKNLNGIQILDWAAHDAEHESFVTWPPELAEEIEKNFGSDPIGKCDAYRTTAADFIKLRDQLKKRVLMKEELSRFYLKKGGWDIFLTIFSESHCAGHHLWHLHDSSHPWYRKALSEKTGDALKEVYRAIDASVGRLLKEAGPETTVFVFGSHGIGPHYEANHLLNEMLRRLEGKRASGNFLNYARSVWHLLPVSLRANLFKGAKKKFWSNKKVSDFSQRSSFPVPNNDAHGGVRLNVVGREPDGKIYPGPEYEAHCEKLARDLGAFVNADTGKPLIDKIYRTKELYPGQNVEHMPDLLIEWNREAPITTVYSPKTGKITGKDQSCRSGDHRSEGIFFVSGPSVRPGRIEMSVSVMDFAPTFASFLGVSLDELDGKSFAERLLTKANV